MDFEILETKESYRCDMCGSEFHDLDVVKKHVKECHLDPRSRSCHTCKNMCLHACPVWQPNPDDVKIERSCSVKPGRTKLRKNCAEYEMNKRFEFQLSHRWDYLKNKSDAKD